MYNGIMVMKVKSMKMKNNQYKGLGHKGLRYEGSKNTGLALSLVVGLTGLMVISGLVLGSGAVWAASGGSSNTSSDSVVDRVNITVPISCSLSGTGNTSHSSTINNGTYDSEIGETVLKAYCNDNGGFAIYATGYTNDEIGEVNSNKLVGSPSSIGAISTGTATSGNTSAWAMKLSAVSGTYTPVIVGSTADTEKDANTTDFSNYAAVPNEYTRVAYRNSATDAGQAVVGSTLKTTYAIYISGTQPAGTYTGQVIYTLVHPSNHVAPVVCNSNATTISEVKCLQDFGNVNSTNRTAIFNSMTTGTQYTMQDKRDGKTYTIAKLADGNVWMTQNLDLDLDASVTYSNEDTDIGYNTTTGEYETAAWSPSASTATSASGWVGSTTTPSSYDPGDLYWNGTTSDYSDWDAYWESCTWNNTTMVYENCNESLNPISTYTSSTGTAQYHLGNYYNWTAAVAMNDSSSHTTSGELIEQSICPAGWTLPRVGDGEDSFQALWEEYGWDENNYAFSDITDLTGAPLYFAAGGFYYGALGDVGGGGSFWSPVAGGSDGARSAAFDVDGFASPSDDGFRDYGYSVRCVARPVAGSVSESGGGGGDV